MRRRVAGFSVLEAVIVLAITGLALTIVFSIGSRASERGFKLGRRVLDISDNEIAAFGFHTIVSGMIAPSTLDSLPGNPYSPPPLIGDTEHFEAQAVADRKTACGGEGQLGLVKLSIQNGTDRSLVLCQVGNGPAVPLLDVGKHQVSFSYSSDGEIWADRVNIQPGVPEDADLTKFKRGLGQDVFVRLTSIDGAVILIERAWTGRPRPRPVDPNSI